MKVEYVDHMGSDLSVVNAARVSFDKVSKYEYDEKTGVSYLSDKDEKLIQYLSKHGHWSPFAHTSITLRVKAPIFVARQLVKHQIGLSWNEVSRRYVDSEPELYHPIWREKAANVKQGSGGDMVVVTEYQARAMQLAEDVMEDSITIYKRLLLAGVCPEQARMVLPLACYTEWIWTGSVYAFARVFNQRTHATAQQETREIAEMIGDVCMTYFPVSWDALTDKEQK